MLKAFAETMRSKDLWIDLDTLEVISDEELRARISAGALKRHQVSSDPRKLPIFGDVERAIRVHIPELIRSTSGLECHPSLRGFKNRSSSCFMDSVLLAIFAIKTSPFLQNLLKNFPAQESLTCSLDPTENAKLVKSIQIELRKDVEHLLSGGVKVCSQLRKLLGKDCRLNGMEDLSTREHDPSELYSRLTAALGYNPILLRHRKTRFGADGEVIHETIDDPVGAVMLPSLHINDPTLKRVSWPDTWTPEEIRIEGSEQKLVTEITVLHADAIVVHIDRRRSHASAPTDLVDRRVEIDETMTISFEDGSVRNYVLGAVVYAPMQGHFAALLRCGEGFVNYDDLRTDRLIEEMKISRVEASKIFERKGVQLYYY